MRRAAIPKRRSSSGTRQPDGLWPRLTAGPSLFQHNRKAHVMPLATARQFGFNLSRTLMTIIILIRTPTGYQAIPLCEYDGSPDLIVAEYDPFD